jgi:hypothetical protein
MELLLLACHPTFGEREKETDRQAELESSFLRKRCYLKKQEGKLLCHSQVENSFIHRVPL